jgi:hypothetical protein
MMAYTTATVRRRAPSVASGAHSSLQVVPKRAELSYYRWRAVAPSPCRCVETETTSTRGQEMANFPVPHIPPSSGQMQGRPPRRAVPRRLAVTVCVTAVLVLVGLVGVGVVTATRGYWYLPGQDPLLAHGHACGTVAVRNNALVTSEASIQAAIACFTAAYAQCRVATLVSATSGTDAGTNRAFIIAPGRGPRSGCGVIEQWDGEVDGGMMQGSGEEVCTGLTTPRHLPNIGATITVEGCGSAGGIQIPELDL